MTSLSKLFDRVLLGRSDQNIRFDELRRLLMALGFVEQVKGSHHIWHHPGLAEIINLQSRSDGTAKPYQVKQVRRIVLEHNFELP